MYLIRYQQSLENISRRVVFSAHIRKDELRFGDLVLVETENSTYRIHVLGDSQYLVSGGCFKKNGRNAVKVKIHG